MTRPMDNLKVRIAPGADLTADRSTWTWVDITPRVHSPVTIKHGRSSESAQSGPDTFEATVENDDGALSPDNPLGPWYPDLDEGTPLQVYWDTTDNIRFEGNITALPIQWRVPTVTAMSPIQSSGPLERMQQGASPLDSPLFRALSTDPLVVAYWPCEDGSDSTQAASPIMGVNPWPIVGEFAAVDGPPGSDRLVRVEEGTSSTLARVPNHTPDDVYVVELAWRMDEDESASRHLLHVFTTSPDLAHWRIRITDTNFELHAWDSDGTLVVNETDSLDHSLFGQWVRVELRLGDGAAWANVFATDVAGTELNLVFDLIGATEIGRITRVGVGDGGNWAQDRYFGQLAVLTGTADQLPIADLSDRGDPFVGYAGELAADRFERLCDEGGLTCSITAPTGGLSLPGATDSYAETPDGAPLDITGDIDVQAWIRPSIFDAVDGHVISKWGASGNRSWFLSVAATAIPVDQIGFSWSADGTNDAGAVVARIPLTRSDDWMAIRATLDVDDGASGHEVNLYIGPSLDGPWVPVHTETGSGTTSIFSSDTDIRIGADLSGDDDFDGRVRAARVYDGIDGTLVASPDFTAQEIGATSFDDAQGNTWTVNGDAAIVRADDTMPMGPQQIDTLVANLQDVPATDGGRLTEHMGGFRYRVRSTLYNQDAALTVTPQPHMPVAPRPTRDNQRIRNDITASSPFGTSARATDQASIAKRGRLEAAITVNPETVDQLQQIAWWRLHIGTVPGMRWPRLPLRLSPSNPDLIADWLAVRVGDRITVDHSFAQIPGVDIDLLIEGWTESWDAIPWDVTLNCVPASPYTVAVFDTSRFDTVGCTLGAGIDDDDTSLNLVSTGRPWVNSTDHAGEFPLDIVIGGERMTITAISGSTSPQTATVTRSINGVVKSHSSGDAVRLAARPAFAL